MVGGGLVTIYGRCVKGFGKDRVDDVSINVLSLFLASAGVENSLCLSVSPTLCALTSQKNHFFHSQLWSN